MSLRRWQRLVRYIHNKKGEKRRPLYLIGFLGQAVFSRRKRKSLELAFTRSLTRACAAPKSHYGPLLLLLLLLS